MGIASVTSWSMRWHILYIENECCLRLKPRMLYINWIQLDLNQLVMAQRLERRDWRSGGPRFKSHPRLTSQSWPSYQLNQLGSKAVSDSTLNSWILAGYQIRVLYFKIKQSARHVWYDSLRLYLLLFSFLDCIPAPPLHLVKFCSGGGLVYHLQTQYIRDSWYAIFSLFDNIDPRLARHWILSLE